MTESMTIPEVQERIEFYTDKLAKWQRRPSAPLRNTMVEKYAEAIGTWKDLLAAKTMGC